MHGETALSHRGVVCSLRAQDNTHEHGQHHVPDGVMMDTRSSSARRSKTSKYLHAGKSRRVHVHTEQTDTHHIQKWPQPPSAQCCPATRRTHLVSASDLARNASMDVMSNTCRLAYSADMVKTGGLDTW
jgi:hypothetical protein